MPEGWRVGSFLDLADLLSGGTPSTSVVEYWDGDIPWVSAKDVSGAKGSFLLEDTKGFFRSQHTDQTKPLRYALIGWELL